MKPLEIVEKDETGKCVNLFISLGNLLDVDVASEFVCGMYAQHETQDVVEARYKKLITMTEKVDKVSKLNIHTIIKMSNL